MGRTTKGKNSWKHKGLIISNNFMIGICNPKIRRLPFDITVTNLNLGKQLDNSNKITLDIEAKTKNTLYEIP